MTGVAGFVGSHLAEALLASDTEVVGVDAFTTYYEPDVKRANLARASDHDDFQLIEGNLRDVDIGELLAGVEVVYHLAAQPGVRRSWGSEFQIYLDENLLAMQLMLEAVAGTDVRRVVFASSSSIYGDAEQMPTRETEPPRPVSPYGVTKLAGEHLCNLYHSKFGVPTVALRYFTVFGPRQRPDMAFARFIAAATEGRAVEVFGDGRQSRDFTFVSDAVAATIAAGERGAAGGVYNVAGGAQATVLDVLDLLGDLLGQRVSVRHLPPVPGDARHTGADVSRARNDLGYDPKVTLEQGLAAQISAIADTARR